ncbi:hypothetical protein BIV57_08150 [Mangrovactinospora gilvigrisea]|uniref:TraD/TraG TraM recognition site domain-containing protein n=1 Tax=Mangrovactinospora gilvigrisea TaxID=1428644 RepID=A0A1J7BH64_9ACTN|nr:type IV secretion system DNA-binding domain-containing protein [Mangrovactinospora gilvigrisea]OIV37998.1 hypothetical protein BIV57_08150 [Mangrovactinospora gilvigrisea]
MSDALSYQDTDKPLRRARYLFGDPAHTRPTVSGLLGLLAVFSVVLAPVTLVVALVCVAVTEGLRARRSVCAWIAGVGVLVVLLAGGPVAAARDYVAGPRQVWQAGWDFERHHALGPAGAWAEATHGWWPHWFTGQLPLALVAGALIGYWVSFIRWLHTDEWMVKPPRKSVGMMVRQQWLRRRIAGGALVSTSKSAVLGVNQADGSRLELFDDERRGHILCVGANGSGKALDVETLIPTPDGLVVLKDLVAGARVLDEYGRPATVVQAHAVLWDRVCLEVAFEDGARLVADSEHLWIVHPTGWGVLPAGFDPGVVHTTAELAAVLVVGEGSGGSVFSNLGVRDWVEGRERVRQVLAVRPVVSRPVRCLTVDSPSRLYLAGATGIPTHNTTTARKVFEADCDRGQPVFYTDLKGERADREEIAATAQHFGRPLVTFTLEGGSWWDPFRFGSFDERRDMLVSGHSWQGSPDYYKDAASLFVQVVLAVLDATPEQPYESTLEQVIALSDLAVLAQRASKIATDHPRRADIHAQIYRLGAYVRRDSDVLNGFITKLEILSNTAAGRWMRIPLAPREVRHEAGVTYLDGHPVMELAQLRRAGAVALFSFSKSRDKDNTARLGRVAVQLQIAVFGQMSEAGERMRTMVLIDEFSALESSLTTELMVRGRSSGADVLLITQTIEDLEIAAQEKAAIGQMLSNVNVLLVHRIGDLEAATRVAGVAGTRRWVKKRMGAKVAQGVLNVRRGGTTGEDLVDEDNEYPVVRPRALQDLVPGRFVLISRSQEQGKRVIQQASTVINGRLHEVPVVVEDFGLPGQADPVGAAAGSAAVAGAQWGAAQGWVAAGPAEALPARPTAVAGEAVSLDKPRAVPPVPPAPVGLPPAPAAPPVPVTPAVPPAPSVRPAVEGERDQARARAARGWEELMAAPADGPSAPAAGPAPVRSPLDASPVDAPPAPSGSPAGSSAGKPPVPFGRVSAARKATKKAPPRKKDDGPAS